MSMTSVQESSPSIEKNTLCGGVFENSEIDSDPLFYLL